MIPHPTHRICDRCSSLITSYCPSIETLSTIGSFHEAGDQAVVDEIIRRENIDPKIVWEYFDHRMRPRCEQKVAFCHSAVGS
jgi:hypothetical protein